MRRLTTAAIAIVCLLVPSAARADDGGWLEFLFRMDPKLVGLGTDIHLLCVDRANTVMPWKNCEELFLLPRLFRDGQRSPDDEAKYAEIRHQVDFRFGYYWMYGQRFADVQDDRSLKALKMMLMYRYHPDLHIAVGFGMGFMRFFGQGFDPFARGILTPLSIVYAPWTRGGTWKKSFIVRGESSYIMKGFTGRDFGNSVTSYATNGGEWNASVAFGFDFRRRTIP